MSDFGGNATSANCFFKKKLLSRQINQENWKWTKSEFGNALPPVMKKTIALILLYALEVFF